MQGFRSLVVSAAIVTIAGCASSPQYESSKTYVDPPSAAGKQCVVQSKIARVRCEREMNATRTACIQQARVDAQPRFAQASERYRQQLSQYKLCAQRSEKERADRLAACARLQPNSDAYRANDCLNVSFSSSIASHCNYPAREPRIDDFVDLSQCPSSERCEQEYDGWFAECGGRIVSEQRCINNCS